MSCREASGKNAQDIRIRRPCGEQWAGLHVRGGGLHFCNTCQRDVHDLSDWTQAQADALLARAKAVGLVEDSSGKGRSVRAGRLNRCNAAPRDGCGGVAPTAGGNTGGNIGCQRATRGVMWQR